MVGQINDALERIWKETIISVEIPSLHLPELTEKTHKKLG
jgi:hypothetical protein